MAKSAADCISPAFEHSKEQLFRPFRFGQWTRLALVGLLAGEMSSGSCRFNLPTQRPHAGSEGNGFLALPFPTFPPFDLHKLAPYIGLIIAGVIVLFIVLTVLLYVSSVFRFILFESVVRKHCVIGESWRRWRKAGGQFFLWQIVFQIVFGMVAVIIIGIPVGIALILGWLQAPREHMIPLVLGGVFVFLVFMAFLVTMIVVHVLAKDFLVPVMGLEDLDFADGWRRVLEIISPEKGEYAIYILLKAALAIAAFIVFGIASIIVAIMLAIPMVAIGAVVVLAGKSAGMGWNVGTIAVAVVAGLIAFAILLYAIALVSVPAIVFFPAYSIYFFAARYPVLEAWLHPPPPEPAAGMLGSESPPQPPPLPPTPEPIG